MIADDPTPVSQYRHWWRGPALSLLILLVAAGLTLRFVRLDELGRLLASANLWWLTAALLCKLMAPFVTAVVYRATLRLLGYRLEILPFWLVAQAATFVNGALPAGPLAMSAFLIGIFRRRGVSEGATTLAVALDTLTYQVAFYGLLAFGLAYPLTHDGLWGGVVNFGGPLIVAALLIAGYLWLRRYDRVALTQAVVRAQQTLARRLRRPWQAATFERFLSELFRGVDLIRAQPLAVGRLLVYQLAVILLDIFTLYCAFLALGQAPPFLLVVLGATLASFLTTLAPLPGGGGAFETSLVFISTRAGVPIEMALGATLIYRVLTFWLPLLLTAVTYRHLIGQNVAAQVPEAPPTSALERGLRGKEKVQ